MLLAVISCRRHFLAVCVSVSVSSCECDILQSACENFTRFTNVGAVGEKIRGKGHDETEFSKKNTVGILKVMYSTVVTGIDNLSVT